MATDSHCHLYDLMNYMADSEMQRRLYKVSCAASSWGAQDFLYSELLSKKAEQEGAPKILMCHAVHPQAALKPKDERQSLILFFEKLIKENRIDAVGETGFDFFDEPLSKTKGIQEELFALHLEYARAKSLPVVMHVRKAMHKVFANSADLKNVPAVIFHSWSGTLEDAQSILRCGINAFFSFGSSILLNHKAALRSCALLPENTLLLETDSPFQPLRGKTFSCWADLPLILKGAAGLRSCRQEALSLVIDQNFALAYNLQSVF